jgi:HemY protein
MLRLVLFLLAVAALAFGMSWLADRPGTMLISWQGYEIETSVFRATIMLAGVIGLSVIGWSALRLIWQSPAAVGAYLNRRRQKRGLEALSSGLIAIGAGDRGLAMRYAVQARKSLPNEPLTHVLRAQAAQLSGDRPTARRIFEAMLGTPDTEQLGLRGLFLEAEREGAREAARQFAERAMNLNPKLGWPVQALFDIQCKNGDWAGALETLGVAKRHNHIDRTRAERRRAVLLTAQAQAAEDTDPERALKLAVEAHASAPDLVPAAAIAGRLLAAQGKTSRAAKILQRTWKRSPHPDLAAAYAYARPGDSPRDRLARVKRLASMNPHSIEGPIAVATAAIEARDWETARRALQPLLDGRLTQRVCTLMARIEGEQHADKGRVREWLARAVNAPRDPAWTADGVVSDHWAPVSPVTGALDAFQWRVPVEALEKPDAQLVTQKLEELVPLGARPGTAIEASGQAHPAAAAVVEAPGHPAPPAAADIVDAAPKKPAAPRETAPSAPEPQLAAASPPVSATPFQTAVVEVGPMTLPANGLASVAAVPAPPDMPAGDAADSAAAPIASGKPANAQPPSPGTARVVAVTKDSQRKPAVRVSEVLSRSAAPGILLAPHSPDNPGPKKNGDEEADPVEQINTPVVSYPASRKGQA